MNGRSQTNRSTREACVGVMIRVQSKLLRFLHGNRGTKTSEEIDGQVKREGEEGTLLFMKCFGVF